MRSPPRCLLRAFIASAAVLFFTLPLPGSLRNHLAHAPDERFGGSGDVQALRVSVFPRPRIVGEGVVVHYDLF